MMVVPVLMTSCQFSENLKNGPAMAQTITIPNAAQKIPGETCPACDAGSEVVEGSLQ